MKYPLLLLVLAATRLALSQVRYDGFQVYRVTPWTVTQLRHLRQLEENPNGLSFWTDVAGVGKAVDIMVPPHMKYDFEDFVTLQRLNSQLWIENVQERIDAEKPPATKASAEFNWDEYQSLHRIHAWLRSLAEDHPETVTVIKAGESYEGRDILGVRISHSKAEKAVFIEGGIHAREWISPATVTFIANELLNSKDPDVLAVAASREWYIFPVINPDGYVYSQTTNRLWRKNRKPSILCHGVDLNRNWDYHWMDGGSSSNPCSESFAGTSAFSEAESKSLSELINSIAHRLEVYIGVHSYSQILMVPFGHSSGEVAENDKEMREIANNAVKKLSERYGTEYTVGKVAEVLYEAGGASSDWVQGRHRHIRLVYSYLLRDTGEHGFLLPPNQIIPTGEETLDSIVSIIEQADADQSKSTN